MSAKLREHLRTNVIGYIALFCFAAAGTAQALPGKNTVDSGDIKNRQVKKWDLGKNAVTGQNVIDGSLTTADLSPAALRSIFATGVVSSVQLADGTIITADLADGSVTTPKLADLAVTAPKLGEEAVATPKLKGNSVTTPKLAEAAVTGPIVASAAIGSDELAPDSVDSSEIRTDAVTATEVADSSIDSGEISDNSLSATDLASGAAGSSEIASSAVDGTKVLNNSLTAADLSGAETNGSVSLSGVANGRCTNVTLGVPGAVAGEAPLLATEAAMQDGILLFAQRVSAAGEVTAAICNFSGGAMTPIVNLPIHLITFN